MSVQRVAPWLGLCLLCLILAWPCGSAFSQPAEAARVIAVTSGAFVERDGARTPLKLKDSLYKTDEVSTDATGKVQLLFADDTTVAVAPDSVVYLSDFSFGGPDKPGFAMVVGRGLARVVTGKVVEQNREGFKITTPHATVGIRGTILTADVRNPSKSTFILSQLGSGHTVSVLNVATGQETEMKKAGFSVDAGATGNLQRPATPAEMNAVQTVVRQSRQTPATTAQSNGNAAQAATASASTAQASSQTAAAAPADGPATVTGAGAEDASGGHGIAGKGETSINQVIAATPGKDDANLRESIMEIPGNDLSPSAGDNPGALKASYAGNLLSDRAHGTFGFDLNLGNGLLDNGRMDVTHNNDSSQYHGANGAGQLIGSDFTLGFDHMATTDPGASGNVTGNISGSMSGGSPQTGPDQIIVNDWNVNTGQPGVNIGNSGPGSGSGSRVQ